MQHSSGSSRTIIEVRPHRGGWTAKEAEGVAPYFIGDNGKRTALIYAQHRVRFRRGEVRIYDDAGIDVVETLPFDETDRTL